MNYDIAAILEAISKSPQAGAQSIRQLADRLYAIADAMEANPNTILVGGMSDRVKMQVIGPDGKTKQSVDSGA